MDELASGEERGEQPTERVADADGDAIRLRQRRDAHRLQKLRVDAQVHAAVLEDGVELARLQLQR